jgi:hypothetical protein
VATSGTYAFNPSIGDVVLEAFSRCGVKRTEITPQHMADAKQAANYLQGAWANDGLILWTVDQQTITLVQGTSTYDVPTNTVMILDLYIVINNGNNRLILPFSRTDYASLANPQQQGVPTSFWFNRVLAPTVTFWPVPDGNETSAIYYRYRQVQDADPRQGGNAEIPYLFLDAFAAGIAHRLCRQYAPNLEASRKMDYQEAYALATKQNTENVPLYISPGLIGYYRS